MKIKTQARIDHLEALLRRVREASRFNERNYRVSQYLGSFDAKLLATLEAYEAMSRDSQPDRAELPSIASSLDPWKGTDEPVRVHRKKKSPPYYRTVFEFGIEHRALQYLVREPLTALLTFHPTQYALCGGNHAAIKRTKQALIDGYLWAVELDIKDCYPSFDEEKLSSLLPLPREVIDHVIISRNLHLQDGWRRRFDGPGNHHECDSLKVLSAARQGIPQGSAVSPLVAEAMIAIALEQVPTLGGVIIAYADNVLLLAKTKSDRDSMTDTLGRALEAHPAGRLRPSRTTFKAGQPIEFLGHVLSLTNGVVRIEPSEKRQREFLSRVSSDLAYLQKASVPASTREERYEALKEYIQGWAAAFTLCDDIEKIEAHWRAKARVAVIEGARSAAKMKVMSTITERTFKLHKDQKQVVDDALALAKQKSGTTVDTVALEYISQEFLGTTSSGYATLKAALTAERKKSSSFEDFLVTVAGLLDTQADAEGFEVSMGVEEKAQA